jgi:hypothetical protein
MRQNLRFTPPSNVYAITLKKTGLSGPLKQWKRRSTIKKATTIFAFCSLITGVSFGQNNNWLCQGTTIINFKQLTIKRFN